MEQQAWVKALDDLRAQKGWSQGRLADELGIDRTYVVHLLGGKRPPSRRVLLEAARLGIDPDLATAVDDGDPDSSDHQVAS